MWQKQEELDYCINYKLSYNPLVLSFDAEAKEYLSKINNHLFKVEPSNSSLRYILTVHLNPKLCYSKNGDLKTIILGKEIDLLYMPDTPDWNQKGYYLKTLKMNRDESVEVAIDFLKSYKLEGYIFLEEILTRYKEDEESQAFVGFLESCGFDD